jgi:hypothetical protein
MMKHIITITNTIRKMGNWKGQHFLEHTCDYAQILGFSASTDTLYSILVTDLPKSKTYSANGNNEKAGSARLAL